MWPVWLWVEVDFDVADVASRTKLQMAKFRQRVEQTRRGGFPEVRRMFCFGFRMSSAMIAMFCVILC